MQDWNSPRQIAPSDPTTARAVNILRLHSDHGRVERETQQRVIQASRLNLLSSSQSRDRLSQLGVLSRTRSVTEQEAERVGCPPSSAGILSIKWSWFVAVRSRGGCGTTANYFLQNKRKLVFQSVSGSQLFYLEGCCGRCWC